MYEVKNVMYLRGLNRRKMSSKIIGAFENGQNDFRKMNLPLNILKRKPFWKRKRGSNNVFCFLFGDREASFAYATYGKRI